MTIRLYIDEDSLDNALVHALRVRGVDVLTANEAGMSGRDDPDHLRSATSEGRVLYTRNAGDFCQLHAEYLASGASHAGIVITRQEFTVGDQMRGLVHLIALRTAEQMVDQLVYLSAWIPPRGS